jgi:hypothetical protein
VLRGQQRVISESSPITTTRAPFFRPVHKSVQCRRRNFFRRFHSISPRSSSTAVTQCPHHETRSDSISTLENAVRLLGAACNVCVFSRVVWVVQYSTCVRAQGVVRVYARVSPAVGRGTLTMREPCHWHVHTGAPMSEQANVGCVCQLSLSLSGVLHNCTVMRGTVELGIAPL